jgi:hypothetical protein
MKNKLITALLAFTALTSLAQQPNNAELLTYLKNIKPTILDDSDTCYSNLISQWNQADFAFIFRVTDEFSYSSSKMVFGSHVFTQMIDIFGTTEGFKKSIREVMPTLDPLVEKSKEELFTQFESIYNKHHQNYCKNNPNGKFTQMSANDIFNHILRINIFVTVLSAKNAVPYPYEIIDTEIAKL